MSSANAKTVKVLRSPGRPNKTMTV